MCPPASHPYPRDRPTAAGPAPAKRLPILLRRAWYGLNQGFRDRLEHLGITPNQFSILRWLSEGDPQGLSQRTLADLMASDANTISSTLTRMEKAGLITRWTPERDRRVSRVRMRPDGRAALDKARPIARAHQDRVLAALPAHRRAKFLEELATIAEACGGIGKNGAKQT